MRDVVCTCTYLSRCAEPSVQFLLLLSLTYYVPNTFALHRKGGANRKPKSESPALRDEHPPPTIGSFQNSSVGLE